MILTADTHLDDNPEHEYRWSIFDILADAKFRGMYKYILGDFVNKHDRHSSVLVNRLITSLLSLTKRGNAPVIILRGNHDKASNGVPYFKFLTDMHGLRYIADPIIDNGIALLPFSPDPVSDWKSINWRDAHAIFMHQTTAGAELKRGITAEGDNLPKLPRVPCYSGDLHIQQTVNGVTYIGAPYPINFGDDYPCRLLELDKQHLIKREIPLDPIQRIMLDISSTRALAKLKVRAGDHVRIRFKINAGRIEQWPRDEDMIRRWAADRQVELYGIEAIIDNTVKYRTTSEVPGLGTDPLDVLTEFASVETISDELLAVGTQFVKDVM